MSARSHISLETKLAAALLALGHVDHSHAKLMTASQICSLYAFDHYPIPHAEDGPSAPWNLVPRLIAAHREKTATVDVPRIAKNKRVTAKHEEFRRRLLAKEPGASARPPSRWPKRGFGR